MKPHPPVHPAVGIACLFAGVLTLNAQTGSEPHYQQLLPVAGLNPSGQGRAMLLDPSNTGALLFGTWNAAPDGWSHTVTKLTPNDAEWKSYDVEGLDADLDDVRRIGCNPGDRLYAVGEKEVVTGGSQRNPTRVTRWKVRSSVAGETGTWVDEDTFGFVTTAGKGKSTTQRSRAFGLATDSNGASRGNVYVCGWASDGETDHWIIRRKGLDGAWRTVLDAKAQDTSSVPYSMAFFPGNPDAPAPAVFAVGIFNSRWTVLRSRDHGASWSSGPAGAAWPGDGSMASAYGIASAPDGSLYVCGARGRDGANRGWVLRASCDGGDTWDTLLDQPSTSPSWAWSLGVGAEGRVVMTGCIFDPLDGTQRWTVVSHSPGQGWPDSWATRSHPLGDIHSSGAGVLADPGGAVFLSGRLTDPGDTTLRIGLLRAAP